VHQPAGNNAWANNTSAALAALQLQQRIDNADDPRDWKLLDNSGGYLGAGTGTAPRSDSPRQEVADFFRDEFATIQLNGGGVPHPELAEHLAECVEKSYRDRGQHHFYGALDPQVSDGAIPFYP
jgi:hypothetical protein